VLAGLYLDSGTWYLYFLPLPFVFYKIYNWIDP